MDMESMKLLKHDKTDYEITDQKRTEPKRTTEQNEVFGILKQDKSDYKATGQDRTKPISVNTQHGRTTKQNEVYGAHRDEKKEANQNKSSKNCIQQVWQKLKDNAVRSLCVVQGLTIIAVVVIIVTTRNDPLNGGWTEWASWGECSATCGTGLQRRERTCTDPEPKFGGKHCAGEPSQYQICNVSKCTDAVGFTAYNASEPYDFRERKLYFSNLVYASDDSFNMSRGVFTCKIAGLYVFTATIVLSNTALTAEYCCYMKINGVSTVQIYASGIVNTTPSSSETVVVKLGRADTVYLGSCYGNSNLLSPSTSFSGALVAADMN